MTSQTTTEMQSRSEENEEAVEDPPKKVEKPKGTVLGGLFDRLGKR